MSRKKFRYLALSSSMDCARLDSELATGVAIFYLLGADRGRSTCEPGGCSLRRPRSDGSPGPIRWPICATSGTGTGPRRCWGGSRCPRNLRPTSRSTSSWPGAQATARRTYDDMQRKGQRHAAHGDGEAVSLVSEGQTDGLALSASYCSVPLA